MIKLSKRLEMVASFVNKNALVADIGADHGYLISYLIENEIIEKGYACENKLGPYSRLKQNIKEFNYQNQIQVDLSDGISSLPSSINTVIIAGMGGDTVIKIINDSLKKLEFIDCFIISSHNKMFEVRNELIKFDYYIEDEQACFDENKFYQATKFIKGKKNYSQLELKYGPILLKNKNKNLLIELENQYVSNKKLLKLESIPESKKQNLLDQNDEINKIINILK